MNAKLPPTRRRTVQLAATWEGNTCPLGVSNFLVLLSCDASNSMAPTFIGLSPVRTLQDQMYTLISTDVTELKGTVLIAHL